MKVTYLRLIGLVSLVLLSAVAMGSLAVTADDPTDSVSTASDDRLSVSDQDVAISGSSVSISSADTASINVDTIPDEWAVADISNDGDFFESTGEINWDFGERDDRTVDFTLIPGDEAEVDDSITLTALNDHGDTEEFTVTVVEAPTELNLTANESSVTVDDSVSFTVENNETAEPIENAILSINTSQSNTNETPADEPITLTTDEDGEASYTFEQTGDVTVTADKSSPSETYTEDTLNFSVSPAEHDSGVENEVAEAVAGLTDGDDDTAGEPSPSGGDMTVLRGNLIEGNTQIDDIEVSGADYTLLRGWLTEE